MIFIILPGLRLHLPVRTLGKFVIFDITGSRRCRFLQLISMYRYFRNFGKLFLLIAWWFLIIDITAMSIFASPDVDSLKEKDKIAKLQKLLLNTKSAETRRDAAEALGALGALEDPRAVQALIEAYNKFKSREVMLAIENAFKKIENPDEKVRIDRKDRKTKTYVVNSLACALGRIRCDSKVADLI